MQKFHLSSEIQPSEVGVNFFVAIIVDQKRSKINWNSFILQLRVLKSSSYFVQWLRSIVLETGKPPAVLCQPPQSGTRLVQTSCFPMVFPLFREEDGGRVGATKVGLTLMAGGGSLYRANIL